jgi:tetratricopeptide (TPR) repeat protein
MRTRLFRLISAGICIALAAALITHVNGGQLQPEKPSSPGTLDLDDAPLPLPNNSASDEARRDRIEALSLFAAARSLELRERYGEALRLYQRASRCDPKSSDIFRGIVTLSIHLKREGLAVRYALKSLELEKDLDPVLLRHLGARLEEEGDWPKALKLYQRALALRSGVEPNSSDDVLLSLDTGRLLMLAGKHKEAADCFAVVVDALDHPDKYSLDDGIQKTLLEDPELTYSLFGDCFLQAGRFDEAQKAFEKSQELKTNDALWHFHLAQVQAKKGKSVDALISLEQAMDKNLSSVGMKPYELLSDVLGNLNKKNELISRLEKYHAEDAKNVSLGYYLADKYLEAEKLDKAEPIYAGLIGKNPSISGFKGLAEIYRKTKQYDKLLSVLGQTVEKTGVLDTLESGTVMLSKDQAAMQGLIEAARHENQTAPAEASYGRFFALGLLALDAKQWTEAREFFQAAVKANHKQAAEVFLVWGVGLLVDSQSADAVKVFQQAIDEKVLPENNAILYFYLAGALAMEGRIDDALAAAQKAVDLKNDSVRFRSRIAWIYYQAKRYDEAIKEYTKLLKQFDDQYESDENREALKEVRLALSNICVLQNKLPEAEEWLQQVLDEFPDDTGAMNDLGYLWADENKRLDRALAMIQKAIEAEPNNGAFRDSLGWALYRLGRYDESVAELLKASEQQSDGVVLDHLGDAYYKAKKTEKARDAWQRAAEMFRKENDEKKAKEMEKKLQKPEI